MLRNISLGGKDTERLYLEPLIFNNGHHLINVSPTRLDCNMTNLINRHKARYLLPTFLFKSNDKILDFPCGSGYAFDLWKDFNIIYEGRDIDYYTIEYAKEIYKYYNYKNMFHVDNLCNPKLKNSTYDVIVCVEGLEHIDKESQKNLIGSFYKALKPKGTLYITTPTTHISGKNKKNKYHPWELTKQDLFSLLYSKFNSSAVQSLEYETIASTGVLTKWVFVFCRKR
jgi:2-polyprenyl-3-methyl-5-hydroxy-6-metoxy-1,4-benzoquinol methylase